MPSHLSLEQEASEINDYRNDGKQETVCTAPKSDIICRKDRICSNLSNDTDINKQDMTRHTQYAAEDIYHHTQYVELKQRHNINTVHHHHKHRMNQAHNECSNKVTVMYKKVH